MAPDPDSLSHAEKRRRIRRILAAGRPVRPRLRPLDLVLLLLIAGQLLAANLEERRLIPGPAPGPACTCHGPPVDPPDRPPG